MSNNEQNNKIKNDLLNKISKKIVRLINTPGGINTPAEFKEFLDYIQNINNTSPMGTLEFMDHMARLDIYDVENPYCKNDNVDDDGWEELKLRSWTKTR